MERYVVLIDDNDKWRKAWDRFVYGCKDSFSIWEKLERDYRGYDIPQTRYVEFETKEDAIMFLLKWS